LHLQLGYLRRIFQSPQPVLDELRDDYGPIVALGFGPTRMVIIGDPSALTELFATGSDSFRWNHRFNLLGFVVGESSMIVSDGEDHLRRRKSVHSAFSRKRLNGWIPMILRRADRAVDALLREASSTEPVDLYPIGRSLVLGIAVHAFFGPDMSDKTEEIARLMQGPQDYLESPAVRQIPHPFPHTTRARVKADRRAMDGLIDEAIGRRRADPSGDPDDVLEALVADQTLTDDEIRDQVVTLIGAGYDTTAATLAWMIIRAVRSPDVWQRLRDEADRVHPITGGEGDHSTLAQLAFADRVMRESLRLHPAGVLSPRQAATPLTIGGYRIDKGTMIGWSPHLAGRDPDVWREPLRFDPDRFADLDPDQQATADTAWVPFGGGTRSCIGFALAQIELTLIISRLAQRLDLRSVTPDIPEPVGMVVNRPTGGTPMLVSHAP
jgi:cytochrome P450